MEAHWNSRNLWLSPTQAADSSTTEITCWGLTVSCASQEQISLKAQHSPATRGLPSSDFPEAKDLRAPRKAGRLLPQRSPSSGEGTQPKVYQHREVL